MPISRGQTPRQLYGLGSFVKSIGKAVKGAVNTVKDVAKSDLGKAALLGAGIYGLGGGTFFGRTLPGLAAKGSGFGISNIAPNVMNYLVGTGGGPAGAVTKGLLGSGGKFSTFGKMAAIAAPAIAGGMFTAKEQEELEELRESGDPEKLKNYLRRYYSNLNINASPEEVESFVRANVAEGGRMQYALGSPEENAMQASGIMGLPLNENPAGVTELDLRESGGFIPPVGVKEKADDIPAMLSNNEFVFTADAVRGMGDGNVNLGAQRMYDMMKKLENGGRV